MLVGEEGEDEEEGFFQVEEGGGAGEHGLFIRVFGGDGSLGCGLTERKATASHSWDFGVAISSLHV